MVTNIELSPWIARFRKFLVAVAAGIVEVGTLVVGGPEWLVYATAIAGTVLVVLVPNDPKYQELAERAKELRQMERA